MIKSSSKHLCYDGSRASPHLSDPPSNANTNLFLQAYQQDFLHAFFANAGGP